MAILVDDLLSMRDNNIV